MANQLNIKTEEAYRLAASLAALTGESLTTAVTEALRRRLEDTERARDRAVLRVRLARLAAEIRATTRGGANSAPPRAPAPDRPRPAATPEDGW